MLTASTTVKQKVDAVNIFRHRSMEGALKVRV